MKSKSLRHKSKAYEYDPARAAKSLTMLGAFIFGHLLPAQVYASPSVATDITAHSSSRGTNIQRNGNVYDVTTTQIHKNAGVNHFNKYNVGTGDLVNMHIPTDKGALVNFIHGGRSDIHGIVNAMKNGKIGGDIYFANRDGIVVGKGGVINAGSIHLSTPSKQFMNDALNTSDANIDLLLSNSFPISSSGLIQVEGELNATVKASIKAGKIILSGADIESGAAARKDIQINYGDIVNVESMESAQSIGVSEDGVIELFGANGVEVKSKSKLVAQGKENGGEVVIESGTDVVIEDSLIVVNAAGPGKAGKINVAAKTNIHLEDGATLSAAGSGDNSDGGDIVVFADEETYFEAGAKIIVDAGASGNAGFGEVSAIHSVFLNGGEFSGKAANGLAGQFLVDPSDLVINTDMIQLDGSSITLEALKKVTVQDALLFSGELLSGDIDAVRNGDPYTLASGIGSITIKAPNISVENAQLVSGGDITLTRPSDENFLINIVLDTLNTLMAVDSSTIVARNFKIESNISNTNFDTIDYSNVDLNSEFLITNSTITAEGNITTNSEIIYNDKGDENVGYEVWEALSELLPDDFKFNNINFTDIEGSAFRTYENRTTIIGSDLMAGGDVNVKSKVSLKSDVADVGGDLLPVALGFQRDKIINEINIVSSETKSNEITGANINIKASTLYKKELSTDAVPLLNVPIIANFGYLESDLSTVVNIDADMKVAATDKLDVDAELDGEQKMTNYSSSEANGGFFFNFGWNGTKNNTKVNYQNYKLNSNDELEADSSALNAGSSLSGSIVDVSAISKLDQISISRLRNGNEGSTLTNIANLNAKKMLANSLVSEELTNKFNVISSFSLLGGVSLVEAENDVKTLIDGNITAPDITIEAKLGVKDAGNDFLDDVVIANIVLNDVEALIGPPESNAFGNAGLTASGKTVISAAVGNTVRVDNVSVDLGSSAKLGNSSSSSTAPSSITINSEINNANRLIDLGRSFGRSLTRPVDTSDFQDIVSSQLDIIDATSSLLTAPNFLVSNFIIFKKAAGGENLSTDRLNIFKASYSGYDYTATAEVNIASSELAGNENLTVNARIDNPVYNFMLPAPTSIGAYLIALAKGTALSAGKASDFNEFGGVVSNEFYNLSTAINILGDTTVSGFQSVDLNSNVDSFLITAVVKGGSGSGDGLSFNGSVALMDYNTNLIDPNKGSQATKSRISIGKDAEITLTKANAEINIVSDDVLNSWIVAGGLKTGSASGAGIGLIDFETTRHSVNDIKGEILLHNANQNIAIKSGLDGGVIGGAVSIGVGTPSGGQQDSRTEGQGSIALIDINDEVRSLFSADLINNSGSTYGVESLKVLADSGTGYDVAAGALTVSLGAKGGGGFSGAVNIADIDTQIEASLNNTEISSSLTGADVYAYAVNTSKVNQYTIAGTVAGKNSTGALAGSVNILNDNTHVISGVSNSTFHKSGTLYLRSLDVDSFDFDTNKFDAESLSTRSNLMVVGGVALGGKVAIGTSVNTYNATKNIKATLADSNLTLSGQAYVDSVKKEETEAVVVAGGVGGKVGLAGAISVYNAGSTVSSKIDKTNITAGSLKLESTNLTEITVTNVGVAGGASAGIAGSVVVNNLGDTTKSEMTGVGVLNITGQVDIEASANQTTDFDVASVGIGGSGGVAGSVVINTIDNNTSALVGSGYTISNASDVSLKALSSYTRKGFVGAIAGGSKGLGAVVTIDDIQNTTNAVFSANKVTITGKVDVQANSYNDYDLLALTISGGSVAIGATVNIVNFGGDISSATGQLKGDNLAEYNTVVSEYNISADSGKTSAAIESQEITAGSINLASKQDNIIGLESGGFAIGGAAIGVGVGVVDVKSEVESRIAGGGDYNLKGSDGLNMTSFVNTDAEVFSYAGTVGANAAINVRVSDYSSTASATTSIGQNTSIDLDNIGQAVVQAKVLEKSNVENISVAASLGLAASGAYVATTHKANSLVEISDGAKITNSTTTNIKSNVLFDSLNAEALGISVGVAAGGILFSEVNIEGSKARLVTGSGSEISGGSVTIVSDLTTEEITSDVLAVSVGKGAISVSDAYVKVGDASGAAMSLGGTINATNNLTIKSLYSNDVKLDAFAQGASGGIVGVSGGHATIINNGTSSIGFGAGADLSGNRVTIKSSAELQGEASAKVLAGGAVGIGDVLSSIDSYGQSHITLAGKIKGGVVDIDSLVSDVSEIDNSSGAGGLVAGGAGGVYNTNTMDATINANGKVSVDAVSLDLTAETRADFDSRINMENYGLIAGAGGKVVNTITQTTMVDLSGGVKYLNDTASTANIEAINKTFKREDNGPSYENILVGLGGYSDGSSSTTHNSDATVNMGAFESADNVDLAIRAFNDTDITDTVKFDSYLLEGGSGSRSTIDSTNFAKVEFLSGDSHANSLTVDAYSDVDLTSTVKAVVSGLIAVDVTTYNTAISRGGDTILFGAGAKFLADKTIQLSSGTGGDVTISNKSYSYNKSVLPVIPDAGVYSNGARVGNISIATGAEIRAGGDITLAASHNDLNVSGYALGHSIALDLLNDIYQATAGWLLESLGLPSSVKYEDEVRSAVVNNNSSITIDGKIQSGLYNYYAVGFGADSGNTEESITTLPVPDGVDADYFQEIGYSLLDEKFSAAGTAAESLEQLRLIIGAFENQSLGSRDPNTPGTYQRTFDALLQQEIFLEQIVANGLSGTEFSQIQIDNLNLTNGNVYLNAPIVSGSGSIEVLKEARILIDNRSKHAVKIGNIDVKFNNGGKVLVNGLAKSGSFGGVSILNRTLADTHVGTHNPGISILGNTQPSQSIPEAPPILLDGRISYLGGDINITNEKGSIIGTKNLVLEGANVRLAAGKDIILGLDNQAVLEPYIVDQRQGQAISDLIDGGVSDVALNNYVNTLSDANFDALRLEYESLLNGQVTTSATEATRGNMKALLTLLTDQTWEATIQNYSTFLVTEDARLTDKLAAIDASKDVFLAMSDVEVTENIGANDPNVNEADVWEKAKTDAIDQIDDLNGIDQDVKTEIVDEINAATTLADFKKWFDSNAITDEFQKDDNNNNPTTVTKTVGYSYSPKNGQELQASITAVREAPEAELEVIDGYDEQLTQYTRNIETFRDAVDNVFGAGGNQIDSTGFVQQTLQAATDLTSQSATVAGENIFISASAVNLNGHLQAGFDTRIITIDDNILQGITNNITYTTGITVDDSGNKLIYDEMVPRLPDGTVNNEAYFVVDGVDIKWNEAEQRIEVGDVEIKGGNITIAGQLFNTGEGNINVVSGYGRVVIDNQTDADIYVGDVTNNYVSGTVTLIDSSPSIGGAASFKKTEYYRELNGDSQVQLVKNVYTRSGIDGDFIKLDAESTIDLVDTRQGIFNPRENLVYTYQNFNLSAEDSELLKQYTTLDIGGEEISVIYDFIPVLSVDAGVYNQIGESTQPGEFNVGTYSTYGSIQLTDGGENSPRVQDWYIRNGFVTFNSQEKINYLFDSTGWYNVGSSSTVKVSGLRQVTTLSSALFGTNTEDYGRLRNYISGDTAVNAYDYQDPVYRLRENGTVYYNNYNDYVFYETRIKNQPYTETTTYQQYQFSQASLNFSHDEAVLRASNPVNINFMGFDRGEVSVTSGGAISVGGIANSVGDTVISSSNGGVTHREDSTIHSDDITVFAGAGSIGSASNMLNLFQDNDARQALSASATQDVYIQSLNGALEFDLLNNGANSDLVLIAEDDLRVKNHNEASKLEARNIYLESKSGELFGSNDIFIDTKSEDGGVILAKSDVGDIKLTETAGDLAVEKIQASGNVEITVRDGGLTDAQPLEERDEDTIAELLALWDDLGLEAGTEAAQNRVDEQYEEIQKQRKSEYEEHWEQREVVTTTYESNLGEDFQYELTDGEKEFFDKYPDRTVTVNGAEVTIEEYTRLGKQAEYELGYSIKGDTYDADFEGATVAETKAYQFYWNLPGNKSTQIAYVAYDENYVYQLSAEEVAYYDGDTDAQQAYVEEKTQYYIDGASLIVGDKSTASYDVNYEFVDTDLRADIEAKMTWSKDELTGIALNFAYKETTDTVLEVEESNIFAGGNVTINANFVGINNGETVLVETDRLGEATTNELFKEMVVQDANGVDVTVKRATEVAKLALLSAERNDIVIDNGQDGNNAKLSVLQREDFDIDAIGEVSIDTTGNTGNTSEHIYLGSEKDVTLKRIASAGDVILKSANNVIAAANQADSHIVYGDVLVIESANGYIGGETPASGEFFKIETSRTTISDADKIGLSARADGSVLIQNAVADQDLWIRDIYSRNGTVALDASGSILDRDNFDYGGDSDSINIGASRVELTSRNGSVGDSSTYGQIELNGDTVLLAQAATGVFVDGEDTLYLEGIINTVSGDITLSSTGDVEFNKLITPNGDINITAQVISSYAVDPFDSNITLDPAVITTSDENRVKLWALGASSTGISVDLDLGAQRGDFEVTGIEKVLINSASTNAFNISTILSETGAVDISQVGNLNIGTVGTPTELLIQTAAGDVDIDTVGGDFSLPPGQIRTPQSVRIAALANGSSISVETLNVAEGLDLQAGSINLGSVDSKDGSVISMDVSGNDGGRADYFEISATENTPLLFTQLFAENFAITTGNDLVTILNGDLGNIGTIASTLYDIEVSAVFQPLGIYDYQLYTATNSFDFNLNGANLYSGNYASYVGYDYIFNGAYRTDESALSLMEMLNALSEINYFYQLETFKEGIDEKKKKANQKDELFEPHVEPKELSKL